MKNKTIFKIITNTMIIILLFSACGLPKPSGSVYIGKWKEENNKVEILEISKQGDNYIIINHDFQGIYSLAKDNSLSEQTGTFKMLYDKNSKKLIVSAGAYMLSFIKVE